MLDETTGLADLQLTVQRLVDADLMLEADATPLLAEIAALLSAGSADPEAVCRLVDHISRLAVVRSPHFERDLDTHAPASGADPEH